MATAHDETRVDLGEDDCVVIPATWGTYLRLLADRGDRGRPKYTFLDGRLTVVSPGLPHEIHKCRLGGLIEEMLIGLRIKFRPCGSVTLLKSRRSREGTEADASNYLTNLATMIGKRKLVMGVDPPPDLAVEVVVSRSERDALEAYRRFGVREVWVCRRMGLEFLVLGQDGQYQSSSTSAVLPFLASEELDPWIFRDDPPSETQIRRLFRARVQETLAPRL